MSAISLRYQSRPIARSDCASTPTNSPDFLQSGIAEEKKARERVDELVAALRLFEEISC